MAHQADGWEGSNFGGAKIALICGQTLLTYERDDKPDIPHAGMWDLPGGGRDGTENRSPVRPQETQEEFGLSISADRIDWRKLYYSEDDTGRLGYLFVAKISPDEVAAVKFGNEGQYWIMMAVSEFVANPDAVPPSARAAG